MQTSFIGDVVLTTPLIERLARDGDVDVITTPAGATLLESHPAVSRVITFDKRGADGGVAGLLRVARRARGARVAYMCQGSARSGALAFLAGCGTRVGFITSDGRWTYTTRVEYRNDWHHARRLLSLADMPLAAASSHSESPAIRPSLFPTPADVLAVDQLTQGHVRPLVVLAPGSAWSTKRWPAFAELAELLAEEYDIAIVGSSDDEGPSSEIRLRLPRERIVDGTGRLSLLGSAELIRRSVAIVSNDSSPQHLASAMGTPTVTIFGPTVPEFGFGPLAPNSVTVGNRSLECRPCDRHGPERCPLGHWRCMNEITASDVADAVRSVISQETNR